MRHWINLFETPIEETTDLYEERRKTKFVGNNQDSFDDDGQVINAKLPWTCMDDYKTANENAGVMTDKEFHERAECEKEHEKGHVYKDLGDGILSACKGKVHNFYV